MGNNSINYQDTEQLIPGISRIICESMGECTLVGWSEQGDIVVQKNDFFTALPEITFNLMCWKIPFEPETHIRYITDIQLITNRYTADI